MSIELLLFCIVLILTAVCLLLSLLVVRNHTQIREIRQTLSRMETRAATAPSPARSPAAPEAEEEDTEEEEPAPSGLRLIRPAVLEAEVRALAGEGRMLEAVQRYRRETGVSLRAAHAAVRDILEH